MRSGRGGEDSIRTSRSDGRPAGPPDEQAFSELYERYAGRIRRYCSQRLGDPHEAEDITQETFARAWRSMPTKLTDGDPYPWLLVVARNLCTDGLRRRSRTAIDDTAGEDRLAAAGDPAEPIITQVDRALLGQALGRLNERQRLTLSLREAEGLTYEQISARTRTSVGAVESVLWRARQALRREFLALDQRDSVLVVPALLAAGVRLRRVGRWISGAAARVSQWASTAAGSLASVDGPSVVLASGLAIVALGGGSAVLVVDAAPGHAQNRVGVRPGHIAGPARQEATAAVFAPPAVTAAVERSHPTAQPATPAASAPSTSAGGTERSSDPGAPVPSVTVPQVQIPSVVTTVPRAVPEPGSISTVPPITPRASLPPSPAPVSRQVPGCQALVAPALPGGPGTVTPTTLSCTASLPLPPTG